MRTLSPDWGNSKLGGRVKLRISDIGNLTPPSERAPLKIIMNQNVENLQGGGYKVQHVGVYKVQQVRVYKVSLFSGLGSGWL